MDAYNASPESAVSALRLFSKIGVTGNRRALLGDMLELGCDTDALHFSVGISAVKYGVTDLYCIGNHSKQIAEGAVFAGLSQNRVRLFKAEEKQRLIEVLSQELRSGDGLLLKASRRLKLEEVLSALKER